MPKIGICLHKNTGDFINFHFLLSYNKSNHISGVCHAYLQLMHDCKK